MKNTIKSLLSLSFLLIAIITLQAQDKKALIQKIDSISNATFKAWNSPGMAIAVVENGEILYSKGFGVTDVNTKEKVDANTLFAVASNTKTFTSTAMMMLQEQGIISLDDKVIDHIPYFRMYNEYVTQNMSIRDLLCHRSGLETFSGDLIWYGTDYSRKEVIEKLRFLQPQYGFREHFGYSNILFLTAGEIIPTLTDTSWNDFIKYRILQPLNMDRTITSTNDLKNMKNVASPHNDLGDGKTIAIPWLNWDNIAPAGAIISSANDMANWLILQLNQGEYNDKQIFTAESQKEMWQMHTPTDISSFSEYYWPDIHFKGYGLGWSLSDYAGKKIVSHNGGYDGMISQSVLIPEENIGFVVLTNCNTWLYMPIMYSLLDVLLNKESSDWNELFLKIKNRQDIAQKEADQEFEDSQVKNAPPSLNLKKYEGIYTCEIYGDVKLSFKDNALWLDMTHTEIFKAKLEHFHYNTFLVKFEDVPSLPQGTVTFTINSNGEAESLKIFIDNPDFDFTEFNFVISSK